MSLRAKLLVVLVGVPLLLLAFMAAAATAAFGTGVLRVHVEENRPGGDKINLVLPAAVVALGMRLMPEEELRRVSEEMRPWLPVMRMAAAELGAFPDGSLVQVQDTGEHVSIVKRGDALVIDVESPQEAVQVSVPLRTLALVARELEATGPAR